MWGCVRWRKKRRNKGGEGKRASARRNVRLHVGVRPGSKVFGRVFVQRGESRDRIRSNVENNARHTEFLLEFRFAAGPARREITRRGGRYFGCLRQLTSVA